MGVLRHVSEVGSRAGDCLTFLGDFSTPWRARSLAGNPDSPQVGVFLTSIIDKTVGVATYYMHYHAI